MSERLRERMNKSPEERTNYKKKKKKKKKRQAEIWRDRDRQ